jgi:hypothetical protein
MKAGVIDLFDEGAQAFHQFVFWFLLALHSPKHFLCFTFLLLANAAGFSGEVGNVFIFRGRFQPLGWNFGAPAVGLPAPCSNTREFPMLFASCWLMLSIMFSFQA